MASTWWWRMGKTRPAAPASRQGQRRRFSRRESISSPAADEQIFPGGTAFLCDAGFTGPHESVIGREIEPVIKRFMTSLPQRFEVAKGRVALQGVIIEIDEGNGRALRIQRVSEPLP